MTKKHTIGRRRLLGGFAAALGLAAAAPAAPAIASGKKRLKMVTSWPKNFPGLGTVPENLAKRIRTMSDGQIDIRVFAAGELVGALESFDAVSTGTADMYHSGDYYWQGKSPAFNFFTTVPFGMTTIEYNAWIRYGGGQELWDELSGKFGVKPFLTGNTGIQMGGWYNKEIETLDDFKGLKIRMPGLGGEVLRRLGAAAVTLPGGEIFPAMKSGAIDASEWVGPWNDLAFGFHQLGKYYYMPGFQEPAAGLALGVNREVWNSFNEREQAIFRAACDAENDRATSEYHYQNAIAFETLVKRHKVQIRRFSPEIMRALKETSDAVIKELAARDPFTRKVMDSFTASLTRSMAWEAHAEEAYTQIRRAVAS